MKKLVVLALTLLLGSSVVLQPTYAAVCGDTVPTDEGELKSYVADCSAKLKDLSGQKQTLSQALGVLSTQINLTQAKIATQTQLLAQLEVEITDLSGKIQSLDYSLTDLTKLFVARVRGSYINSSRVPLAIIFESTGVSQFVKGLEYVEAVRDHDRNVLISLEKSRLDYDAQKTLKEEKQAEIEVVKANLDREKAALTTQVAAKNKLLADTKNDEARYQSLRAEAQKRVAQLANYVSSRGGGTILSGTTKCDDWGCYYNQRDSQWGNQSIGNSSMSMASVGCLVTAAAMIASHYGRSLTPGDIASSSEPFEYDTADMRFTWIGSVGGTKVNRSPQACSGAGCLPLIDSELSSNRPVIVRISATNIAGTHFIVITKKEGDNYIMKDPYEADGNNVSFTSKHQISSLTRVDRVTVN